MRCIFCCEEKDKLTEEHIIPKALASNFSMQNASCPECQRKCNTSFEQQFLKGSNFISMIRAQLGLKGRRNAPIFGFDQHGHPLTQEVQPGFPPIRLGLSAGGFYQPPQVILTDAQRTPLNYSFLPDTLQPPLVTDFFEKIVEAVPDQATTAAFWADGNLITANGWRDLLETFVAWANRKGLSAMASCVSIQNAAVSFTLDWNVGYRDRGLTKIAFTYLVSVLSKEDRCSLELEPIRRYILDGTIDASMRWSGPVFGWPGQLPALPVDLKFSYLLATVYTGKDVLVFVTLLNMGCFFVRIELGANGPVAPDTLVTFYLDKGTDGRYTMRKTAHNQETTVAFTDSVRSNDILTEVGIDKPEAE